MSGFMHFSCTEEHHAKSLLDSRIYGFLCILHNRVFIFLGVNKNMVVQLAQKGQKAVKTANDGVCTGVHKDSKKYAYFMQKE